MAIEKAIEFKGIELTYWHIRRMIYEADTDTTRLTLWGYADQKLRDNGVENRLDSKEVVLEGSADIDMAYKKISAGEGDVELFKDGKEI